MSKSVLLIEDNRLARMMMNSIITETNPDWSVDEAHSAEAAMALLEVKKGGFDIILIDVGLPGMDGLELASRIRENGNTASLAVVTANIQKPIRQKAEELGATFIEKPVNTEKLVDFFSMVNGKKE